MQNPLRYILFLLFILFTLGASAQRDTVVYIGINGRLVPEEHAIQRKEIDYRSARRIIITHSTKNDGRWLVQYRERIRKIGQNEYRIKGMRSASKASFIRNYEKTSDGNYNFSEFVGETLVRKGTSKMMFPLILHGEVTEYSLTGNIRSRSVFRNNELVSNENWLESGEKYIDNVFYSVDSEPLFSKGMGAMHGHVRQSLLDSGLDFASLSGNLIVGFVVMEDGTIDGIRILKGITPGVNAIAVNAIKSLEGNWTPAKLNGRVVRYFQVFPINFIHREYRFDAVEFTGSMLHWERF